jgi:hypothetical protein
MDFNRSCLSAAPINTAINDLIEAAAAREPETNNRQYLGASSIGSECLRRAQFDWMVDSAHSLRTRDIFHHGHVFETLSRQHLVNAGFRFAPDDALGFRAVGGLLRGHADGIIIAGPNLPGAYLIFPCVWEHKCLGAKGWHAIERDGIEKADHQCRYVRAAAPAGAVQCRARAGLVRSGRNHNRGDARRRAFAALHYRSRGLALPLLWTSRALLGTAAVSARRTTPENSAGMRAVEARRFSQRRRHTFLARNRTLLSEQ